MNNRKRNYFLLSVCIAAEFLLVQILKDSGVPSPTGLINAICTLLFFLPIVILLLYLSNDKRIKKHWRIILRLLVLYIGLSYIAGMIATLFV